MQPRFRRGGMVATIGALILVAAMDSAAADIAHAEDLVDQALAVSPRNAPAHFAKAQVLRTQGRCEEAIPEFETVIAVTRNSAGAYSHLGWCKLLTGSTEEVIPLEEHSIRSLRSLHRLFICPDWARASAGVAHRGGYRLVRKGIQGQSSAGRSSRHARLRLCPQGRERTHRRQAR